MLHNAYAFGISNNFPIHILTCHFYEKSSSSGECGMKKKYTRDKKDTDPYEISTMGMGSLWQSKTYL